MLEIRYIGLQRKLFEKSINKVINKINEYFYFLLFLKRTNTTQRCKNREIKSREKFILCLISGFHKRFSQLFKRKISVYLPKWTYKQRPQFNVSYPTIGSISVVKWRPYMRSTYSDSQLFLFCSSQPLEWGIQYLNSR